MNAPAPAAETAAPAPSPLRIQRLSLTDFRAFPGPAPAEFNLDGKNLLVYGENGSGKSSIFHALNGFFSLKPARTLLNQKNVFSAQPDTTCKVEVIFTNDDKPIEWNSSKHPCATDLSRPASGWYHFFFRGADARVLLTALRGSFLDYRSLLDTNYKHGGNKINLFDIAVERLLSDFPVPVAGGTSRTIGELWQAVEQAKPEKHTKTALAKVNQACADFNNGFNQALAELHPLVGALLGDLIGADVTIAPFVFGGITYAVAHYKRDRVIAGRSLTLNVSYRTRALATPQNFLNEARLSALALAIYLAGRLACTPTATADALKLLVLDDVLIGLDHSNRLPVLDVLDSRFSDWQTVLLTHDRNWFDLARSHLPEGGWKCVEIYEGDSAATAPMPIVRPVQNRPALALLEKAKELIKTSYVEAAANYARQSFELGVRSACELKGINMPYRVYPKTSKPPLQAQDFLNRLKTWRVTGGVKQADWDVAIKRLEELKNVVMNPYSHPDAPNIPKQEVERAIDAVEKFLEMAGKKP